METPYKNEGVGRSVDGYVVNAYPDVVDFRDYVYEPPLIQIRNAVRHSFKPVILDQGKEGACTGFGLASVINTLNKKRGNDYPVSPRMLYELARRFDEWPGNDYSGASCRGAIKGWYAMGVCRESQWPYREQDAGHLTVERAKNARENRIGAYYRLNHRIADFHAAINETGAIYCSATVHPGWDKASVKKGNGQITFHRQSQEMAGHAFALIGYDEHGFIVQNSWGNSWGDKGTALWTYEDWFENIRDAWAFRLSLSSKAIWLITTQEKPRAGAGASQVSSTPVRSEIAGHFVHIDDGKFERHGAYWSDLNDVEETAELVANSDKYDHLLFYAHGGLNSPKNSARRIRAMAPVFKRNRIYPYHFMYDTGLFEELKDSIFKVRSVAEGRVGGVSDWTDAFFEKTLRKPGRALWREMKDGASKPFQTRQAGHQTLAAFASAFAKSDKPKHIHVVGHSLGSVFVAHLLEALELLMPSGRVKSVSLMAPAATVSLFKSHYYPLLTTDKRFFGIDSLDIYNLNNELEEDDSVAKLYRKSLLYLVSRSFEEKIPAELLGMQKYSVGLDRVVGKAVDFHYSDGTKTKGKLSSSRSHGGFDNDPLTMNSVLTQILGKKPKKNNEFQDGDIVFAENTDERRP